MIMATDPRQNLILNTQMEEDPSYIIGIINSYINDKNISEKLSAYNEINKNANSEIEKIIEK